MSYDKYAKKAYTKVKQYGAPIKVKRAGKKVYDPATNSYVDNGAEFTGFALQSNFEQKDVDGTNIKFGDVKFMAVLDDTPKSNDVITFGNKTYTVISVSPLNMDGITDIYVTIQAR